MRFASPRTQRVCRAGPSRRSAARRLLTVLPAGRPNPHSLSTPARAISEPAQPISEPPRYIGLPHRSLTGGFEPEEPFLVAHYARSK